MTLHGRRLELGLDEEQNYSDIEDEVLDVFVRSIIDLSPNYGGYDSRRSPWSGGSCSTVEVKGVNSENRPLKKSPQTETKNKKEGL